MAKGKSPRRYVQTVAKIPMLFKGGFEGENNKLQVYSDDYVFCGNCQKYEFY